MAIFPFIKGLEKGEIKLLEEINTGSIMKSVSDGNSLYFSGENKGESYIAKYDLQGNLKWRKSFDYGFEEGIHSVELTGENEILFSASSTKGLSYLKKFDKDGKQIWAIERQGAIFDIEERNNIIYISGGTGTINEFSSSRNGYISAINLNNGNELWSKNIQIVILHCYQT